VDLSKLSTADKVISISAIVLFIASFLPWFKVEVEGGEGFGGAVADGNGWDVGFLWSGIPVLLGLAMLAIIAIRAFSPDTSLPDLPVTWGQAFLGAGALAALLVLLKLLIGEDDGGFDFVEVNRAYGLFLAAIAAIGLAVGGFLKMQEDNATGGATPGAAPPQSF
jgi:hypothetical protein